MQAWGGGWWAGELQVDFGSQEFLWAEQQLNSTLFGVNKTQWVQSVPFLSSYSYIILSELFSLDLA